MASTTTGQNGRFCGDILRIIFEYYATVEDFDYPLENLLLVCKAWRDAGLSHGRLWSSFQLHIEHEKTNEMLLKRTPLRLKRSAMAPMDIEVLNLLGNEASFFKFEAGYNEERLPLPDECPYSDDFGAGRRCPCYDDAYSAACALLVLLAGKEGENCKRWRTLMFYPTYDTRCAAQETMITRALSHPTPLLESLTLQHIHITGKDAPFLPYTPSLVQLALDSCDVPFLRGTKILRFAAISWDLDSWNPQYKNRADLKESTELEVLRIGLPNGFKLALPHSLPKLRELWLSGNKLPNSVRIMKMEGLRHLYIGVDEVALITQLVGCAGEAFWQVDELTLRYLRVYKGEFPTFKSTMFQLFKQFVGVDVLRGDTKMLGLVIKLLWDQLHTDYNALPPGSARMFGEKEITLRMLLNDEVCEELSPMAVSQDLVDAAENLEVVDPRTAWDEVYQVLAEYEDVDYY